jgi:hypothetical protein
MFGISIVPSILLALGMAVSPESPRWLFQVCTWQIPYLCFYLKLKPDTY